MYLLIIMCASAVKTTILMSPWTRSHAKNLTIQQCSAVVVASMERYSAELEALRLLEQHNYNRNYRCQSDFDTLVKLIDESSAILIEKTRTSGKLRVWESHVIMCDNSCNAKKNQLGLILD